MSKTKQCPGCNRAPPFEGRFCSTCRKNQSRQAERAARLASDFETLRPGDVGQVGDDYRAPNYDREKKQEFNAKMGAAAETVRRLALKPEKIADYISLLAEQERRWGHKRLSRSVSIGMARDVLFMRQFEQLAERVRWPVKPEGYAARPKHSPAKRIVAFPLSDLHVGAMLPGYENPETFDFTAASRRLAWLFYQAGEYKTQYRDRTELVLGLLGDLIEGLLGWNDQDNAPLSEQMVACGAFLVAGIRYLAARFPSVRVVGRPGNHGRNKLRHPGRATSSKWDSYETILLKFVEAQCRDLKNVKFDLQRAPWAIVPLFDANALWTHGDTHFALKAPSSSGGRASWERELTRIQSSGKYGERIKVLNAGHFHDPDLMPFDNDSFGVCNGCLVPSNGHAQSGGHSSRTGFWLWEAVEGHAVGDVRFLSVGAKQDGDSSLDAIVPPFEPWGRK